MTPNTQVDPAANGWLEALSAAQQALRQTHPEICVKLGEIHLSLATTPVAREVTQELLQGKSPAQVLHEKRSAAAHIAFHGYDHYGDHVVEGTGTWNDSPQDDRMWITAHVLPDGAPRDSQTERWVFSVVFRKGTADIESISDGSETSAFLRQQREASTSIARPRHSS